MGAETKKPEVVTRVDLLEHGDKIKKEMSRNIEKVDAKVDEVSRDLADVKTVMAPLSSTLDQIAENTKETATTLNRFASDTTKHLHEHDIELTNMKASSETKKGNKTRNVSIILGIITLIGGLLTAVIGIIPAFLH